MVAVTVHSDLDPKKIKSVTVCTFLPSICHEVVMPGLPGWLSGQEFTCDAEDAGDAMGLIPGLGRSPEEGIGYPLQYSWPSLVAQTVKNLPAMQETPVRSLGWEDPPEKG